MKTMKIDDNDRSEIFAIVCAILHLGNVVFNEGNNDQAFIQTKECKYLVNSCFKIIFMS